MSKAKNNYNLDYFNWYKNIGKFGGKINEEKFSKYIKSNDNILDFGCGGGYLLANLQCNEKHGVEINEHAIEEAKNYASKIYKNTNDLPNNYYDKIISNHSLQHCEHPFLEVQNLYRSLKKDGLIILVTSCSSIKLDYKPNDINYQLYSWSPLNIGNLLDAANFKIISIEKLYHKWPPKYEMVHKLFGVKIFKIICKVYGLFDRKITQVISVGKKIN